MLSSGDTGLLHVTAHGRPDQLATLEAGFEASKLDIAPFAAFAPGPLVAAKGMLSASLKLRGFDPDTGFAFSSNGGDGTLTLVHEDAPDKSGDDDAKKGK